MNIREIQALPQVAAWLSRLADQLRCSRTRVAGEALHLVLADQSRPLDDWLWAATKDERSAGSAPVARVSVELNDCDADLIEVGAKRWKLPTAVVIRRFLGIAYVRIVCPGSTLAALQLR